MPSAASIWCALAGGWTFRTAPDLAPRCAASATVPRKLSRAAVETLAIIAYHQPVTRAEIEAIRGVALARGTLDRLLEAGWVQPKGRRESAGRPLNWVDDAALPRAFRPRQPRANCPGSTSCARPGLLDIGPAVLGEMRDRREPEEPEPTRPEE